MAASPFAQAFNAISSVPSRSGEIRSIKQELADVQTFRTYLSSLRERPRQAQGQGTAAQGQARATGAGGTGAGQPPAAQGQARPPGQARPQGQGQGQVPSTGQPRPAQGQVQSQQRPAQGQVQGQPPARQVPNRSASAGPLPDPQSKARASLD